MKKNVIVEIINDQHRHCETNEEGDLVVTTLTNKHMPLIRYKTGDRGYYNDQNLLTITKARCNDSISINEKEYDGSVFWGVINIVNSEYCANKIKQFQVVYQNNTLYFYLVMELSIYSTKEIAECIQGVLTNRLNWPNIPVQVNLVEKIIPHVSKNKIKYFINLSSFEPMV